jgi:hypothetical protein
MATLLTASGESRDVPGPLTLVQMQTQVGGWIELVTLRVERGARIALVVDDEGKLKGKPVNIAATALYHAALPGVQDVIVGDALLVRVEHEGVTGQEAWR